MSYVIVFWFVVTPYSLYYTFMCVLGMSLTERMVKLLLD